MTLNTKNYIAIDIAKDSLQVQAPNCTCALNYDKDALQEWITSITKGTIIVFEATGGYERMLMQTLIDHHIPYARVSPDRVRAFAKSEGIKAKTDPIDAKMLLRFAEQKQLKPNNPPDPQRAKLVALLDRRSHLSSMHAQEKNRRQNSDAQIHELIDTSLDFIEGQIDQIDQQIRGLIGEHPVMQAQGKILQSITGIGEVTAWSIIAYLEGIVSMKRNQMIALAGLAPFNKDSGKSQKKRSIQGGRAKVRRVLYMAAATAAIHNPHIKEYVEGLRARGKPYKCAIVAAMRKLLIHAQSLLKNPENALA